MESAQAIASHRSVLISKLYMISFCDWKILTGIGCMGPGLGNMDGRNGNYTVHLFPAGYFLKRNPFSSSHLFLVLISKSNLFASFILKHFCTITLGGKSSIDASIC